MRRSILLLLVLSWLFRPAGHGQVFDQNRNHYMNTEGADTRYYSQRVWAWLEKIRTGEIDPDTYMIRDIDGRQAPVLQVIHRIVRCWGTLWDYEAMGNTYPPYDAGWKFGNWQTSLSLIWILRQYGDVILPEDHQFLRTLYTQLLTSRDFCPGTENTRVSDMVSRYLMAEENRDAMVTFSYENVPSAEIRTWSWEGRYYHPGNTYNAYQLAKDWLNLHMYTWMREGNRELDSPQYTHIFIHAFYTLYQFAREPEMARKAKMMTDLLMLDCLMDFDGRQWGGATGRSYVQNFRDGHAWFYWSVFWDAPKPTHDPPLNIYVAKYRLPDVIYDIGDLSDERENYYHLSTEYNPGIVYMPNTGKWNFITKYYSLGGGSGTAWQLCIHSDDLPGSRNRPGLPFRVWINSLEDPGSMSCPALWQCYMTLGQKGFQYKNAIFSMTHFYHEMLGSNTWDYEKTIGEYHFKQEGRVMMVYRIRKDRLTSGLEVAIQGVDYPSMAAFQAAVLENCDLDGGKFVTSRGDWVGYIRTEGNDFIPGVNVGGKGTMQPVYSFPHKRLQCVDHFGRHIIRWDNDVMTVRKHGRQIVYDFKNWAWTESTYEEDLTPPAPPQNVTVGR